MDILVASFIGWGGVLERLGVVNKVLWLSPVLRVGVDPLSQQKTPARNIPQLPASADLVRDRQTVGQQLRNSAYKILFGSEKN